MSVDKTVIGARIQCIRKEKQLRQKDVAEALKLTDQYISKIERGGTAMTISQLSDIADFLGVDLYDLIGGANKGSPDYKKSEMLLLYEGATPRQREKILAHAKIVVAD